MYFSIRFTKTKLALLTLFLCSLSFAQVNTTVFTISNGTYTEISGGTVLGTTTSDDQFFLDTTNLAGGTIRTGMGLPIGFNFTMNGNTFDRFGVNNNGWIALGKSALTPSVDMNTTSAYLPISSAAVNTPPELRTRIAPFAKDLAGQTGSELSYIVNGSAPNRVLVVQWKGYRKYNNTGDIFNFQVQLFETSNKIIVVYGDITSNATSGNFQIGLGGNNSTDFANVTNTTDWSTTLTAGSLSTSTCTLAVGNTPASGLTFQWVLGAGPIIGYTPLVNTWLTGNNTFTATITDVDGIATGTLKPRVYWKVNGGSWTSAAATNSSSPFSFTIGTTGLVIGDSINYFVIAQDLLGNVSANPGQGLVAANVNTITTYPTNPNYYKIILNPNYGGGSGTSGGYYFANSTPGAYGAPSYPTYNWIDSTVVPFTEIASFNTTGDDAFSPPITIPFSFNFYGTAYTQLWVNSNCWITFSDLTALSTTIQRTSVAIPTAGGIENYIAAILRDMNVTNTTYADAHVYYGGNSSFFVITFWHAHIYGSATDYVTFQIILKSNGNVKIQYNEAESTNPVPLTLTGSGTIGIENADGTAGIQYRFAGNGGPMFGSNLALEFGTNAATLPVELASFTANAQNRNVVLNWNTKTEKNANRFVVERLNGTWQEIGFINAAGTSTSEHNYTFTDSKLNSGHYSYRLKCVDFDGTFSYSNIAEVSVGLPTEYMLSQNYPNPFNPSTKIDYQLPMDAKVTVELYTITGERAAVLVNSEQSAGYYTLDVNSSVRNLASGMYIYRMNAVDQSGKNFMSIKKMMLMK